MPIISERLNKVFAERKKLERKMHIKSDVELTDISLKDIGVGTEAKKAVVFSFNFVTNYGEDSGKIEIDGEVFYTDKEEKMKEIVEDWKKGKVDDKLRLAIMNKVLELSYIQAIALAEQVRLPPPIQMPHFVAKKK